MVRKGALLLALGFVIAGCRDLPSIDANECGNGVIEEPEVCDTFAPNPGGVCRPKGSVGECRLDCRKIRGEAQGVCPSGWGCDSDGLCRMATGDFETDIKLQIGGVDSLAAADFDGDGRADLISREPGDVYQRGKLRVHYLDEASALNESRSFPKRISAPFLGDINGDGRADVVFNTFQVGVLLGRADRSWVPETFSSYRIANAHIRILGIADLGLVSEDTSIVALTTLGGETGIFIPTETGSLGLAAPLPEPVENLAGDAVTGHVIVGPESPCREIVLGYRGADYFSMFDVCDRDPVLGFPTWKPRIPEQRIEFAPPAQIDQGPLVADLNGDGALDVLIGASGRVYAAYGDGKKLASAVPFVLHNAAGAEPDIAINMPLAVGEFSGDHAPDFVFPDLLLASAPSPDGVTSIYAVSQRNIGVPWTTAQIVDLNGNGKPDVVAASNAGLDVSFFNGTSTIYTSPASLSTVGPVERLTIGDYDGDQLMDVAFIERAASSNEADSLRIAYGSAFGAPSAPITVARVSLAEQVASFTDAGTTGLVVASSELRDGVQTGKLTELDGDSDRLPLALHSLVRVDERNNVASSQSLGIAVGAFTAPGRHDLLSLAVKNGYEFWLIPSIEDDASVPVQLGGTLDPNVSAISMVAQDSAQIALAATSADLDGDGRDEAIWLSPNGDDTACAVSIFDVDARALAVRPRGLVLLDRPCDKPAIVAVDADEDGHVDLAVLTSDRKWKSAALSVLWNDGTGGFDASRSTPVSKPTQAPRAFTTLGASPARGFTFAFVTETTLELAGRDGRHFEPNSVLALERGSAVAAADFNGDGITDLALGDADKVRVLRAQLLVQ